MATRSVTGVAEARAALQRDGYVVIEGLLPAHTVAELRGRIEQIMADERAQAFGSDGGAHEPGDGMASTFTSYWDTSEAERALLARRIRATRAQEFDTPWPVPEEDVCINFVHIPTFFDEGRSQRIFNLINKDVSFAPLIEHPLALGIMDAELGRDCVLLDVSVNHVGPDTGGGRWHVDSPISRMPEPLPQFTLSIQSVWMLDDFTEANGATHVAAGSHTTFRAAPGGRDPVDGEVVLEGPAGSLAVWLSQTWHRHGPNRTDTPRPGVVVQYGRAWVKPFVDLRTPMTDEQAALLSPRLRYLMGCGANPPVRG